MNARLPGLLALLLASGCAFRPPIDHSYTARSQDSRAQFLIIHFTNEDWASSLKILTEGPVSSHYLLRADPVRIYQLVDENRRAYHAGVSTWKGQTMLNAASIGIEVVNPGDTRGPDGTTVFHPYPPAQIDALVALVKDIVARHQIRGDRILGHSDIAPLRKVDPGPTFPWKRFADEGLIPWPDAAAVETKRQLYQGALPDVAWFQSKLTEFGYAPPRSGELDDATKRNLSAFQMKYRPAKYDGVPDAETAAILEVMTAAPTTGK